MIERLCRLGHHAVETAGFAGPLTTRVPVPVSGSGPRANRRLGAGRWHTPIIIMGPAMAPPLTGYSRPPSIWYSLVIFCRSSAFDC